MTEAIRRFNRYYARALGVFSGKYLGSEFSLAEVRILGEISRHPGISAYEISSTLGMDKSYLSRTLARMTSAELIRREQDPANWRAYLLFLTEKGKQTADDLDARADERIRSQIAALSKADQHSLVTAMETIERLLSPVIPPEKQKDGLMLQKCSAGDAMQAMEFINEAKAYLKAQGIDQWQTGYPDSACIEQDIADGKGFFLMDDEKNAIGYVCIDLEGEPAYLQMEGTWLTGADCASYGVVHRLALTGKQRGKGYAAKAFQAAEDYLRDAGCRSVRMDTDEDNAIMKHLLARGGYTFCGKIRFDNSDKIAYEKLIAGQKK